MIIRKNTFVMFVLCSFNIVSAQTYFIPDSTFRSYLVKTYPSVMDSNQRLIISQAQNLVDSMEFSGKNISSIDGLQYFQSVISVNASGNNISSFPGFNGIPAVININLSNNKINNIATLSNCVNLIRLELQHNQLSILNQDSLPELLYLDVSYNNLTSLPYLRTFKLKDLKVNNNQINGFATLSLSYLETVEASNNQLTSFPDFSICHSLNAVSFRNNLISETSNFQFLDSINSIDLGNNQINLFPDLSTLNDLSDLRIDNNNISELPYGLASRTFTRLDLSSNRLGFDDCGAIYYSPSFNNIIITPQDSIGSKQEVTLKNNDQYVLSVNPDTTMSNLIYKWYKNGQLLKNSNENSYTITAATNADAGIYYCQILSSDTKLSGFTLCSYPVIIHVNDCLYSFTYTLNEISFDCNTGAVYEILIQDTLNSNLTYTLRAQRSGQTITSVNNRFTGLKEDSYDLIVKDSAGCEKIFSNVISLSSKFRGCKGIVITPNGDGIADNLYIEQTGKAVIINADGVKVKDLNVPGFWDGSDNNGNPVALDYYVIVINDSDLVRVSVIK